MSTTTRTDIHRPSAIDPEAYEYVSMDCCKEELSDIGEIMMLADERRAFRAHRERTGGKFSSHNHGGNCHICGAHCLYEVIFYHPGTNAYIKTGTDCAEKLDMGDPEAFRNFRSTIADVCKRRAGRTKAKMILGEVQGGPRAWELYNLEDDPTSEPARKCRNCSGHYLGCEKCQHSGYTSNAYGILCSIVGSVIRNGHISQGAEDYLPSIVDQVDHYEQIKAKREAQWQAEKDAAQPVPTDGKRHTVTGTVLKKEVRDGQYGTQYKMTVKTDAGFILWGSIPGSLLYFDYTHTEEVEDQEDAKRWKEKGFNITQDDAGKYWIHEERQRGIERGDRVTFTAALQPSDRDPKFGFYKRPTKAGLA